MPRSSRALRRFNYLLSETDAAYHEAASRLGLSDSVMQILYTVCDSDSGERCPLSEVCRRTGISKQTINSALRRLEAGGCLTVYSVEHNGRLRKFYHITPNGVAQIDQFLASWPEIERVYDFIKESAVHDACAVSK